MSDFISEFKDKQRIAYACNVAHGFHETEDNFAEKVALVHSELSEALEYFRKGGGISDHIPPFNGIEEEFADVIIRLMDISQSYDLPLAEAIVAKMAFNETRPYRHGGKRI